MFTQDCYSSEVESGHLSKNDIQLERDADNALRDAGCTNLTTPAIVNAQQYRRTRYHEVSWDRLPDTIPARVDLDDDPAQVANAALAKLGTHQQRLCYLLYALAMTQTEIAARMAISQQRVSKLLSECQALIAAWYDQAAGWQQVYMAEVSGRSLRIDTDKEATKTERTINRLKALGREIVPAGKDRDGDAIFLMDNYYRIRADQLQTLLHFGEVRTRAYGLIKTSRIDTLREVVKAA